MRLITIGNAPALTPQQVERLKNVFHDVDEKNRSRAIHFIDRGIAVFNAMQSGEDKPNPLKAANQVTRIKAAIMAAIEELNSLSPDTVEAFNSVATNNPNFQKIVCDVTGRGIINQLHDFNALCHWTLQELPTVGKKGRGKNTGNKAGERLAMAIMEAYGVAYNRSVTKAIDTKKVISRIYRILKLTENPAIMTKLSNNTENIK